MDWAIKLARARANPRLAVSVALALLRGSYYRLKYRVLRQRVIIGRGFKVMGPLDIRGPGTVIFGDHCSIVSTRLHPTTPYTHSPDALIKFGNRVVLTGTRFGCHRRIEVGDGAGLSDARIMDTDFHDLQSLGQHRANTSGRMKPIVIGPNTWVAAGAMILKGVTVGENSVVGAGAVVIGNVPPNAVVFGNPARVIWRIKQQRSPE
jgi:acetyltransferase-like isoleucine patch superfamily enzyme